MDAVAMNGERRYHVDKRKKGAAAKETKGDSLRRRVYLAGKRTFDFTASLCAGGLLLLPMLIISLIIMAKDFGNPFYVHKRVGQGGKEIGVLKFRSMKTGADRLKKTLTREQLEEYRREFKLRDDPRLIGYQHPGDGAKCFGAFLRRTSMDELPQILWNICIKGDMSIVGPRPILREELRRNYTPEERRQFLSVKPGLTGYWQAYARNDAEYETGERQSMELYYVEHQSFWLDLKIILKTAATVLRGRGAV